MFVKGRVSRKQAANGKSSELDVRARRSAVEAYVGFDAQQPTLEVDDLVGVVERKCKHDPRCERHLALALVGRGHRLPRSGFSAMENFSHELSQRRIQTVSKIKTRVAQHVGSWLEDHEAVSIAIAAATRVEEEILEYLCNPTVAKRAVENAKTIAITAAEWETLFGVEARHLRTSPLESLSRDPTFAAAVNDVQNALKTTIQEEEQKCTWSRAITQAACTVGMHMQTHEDYVSLCLGNIVRSDLRRLEDLQYKLEDEGVDAMLVGATLGALAKCVV